MEPAAKPYYEQRWEAIGKHMLSHGFENADLAAQLGMHKDTVRKARSGTKPFSEAIMEKIPPIFGAQNYDELIAQANAMPAMSPDSVMDAIYRTAAHKHMTLAQVNDKSGFTSKIFTQPTIGIKAAAQVATHAFGLRSVAEMVTQAQEYPEVPRRSLRMAHKAASSEPRADSIYNDALLTAAVLAMQHKRGFTDEYMAEHLGITRSQYMTTINNKRFQSDEERAKLLPVFRCQTIEQLVKVSKVEPENHWSRLLNSRKLAEQFGNPTKSWERD